MPNDKQGKFVQKWCDERHQIIDKKLEKLENRVFAILLTALTNVAGIAAVLAKMIL